MWRHFCCTGQIREEGVSWWLHWSVLAREKAHFVVMMRDEQLDNPKAELYLGWYTTGFRSEEQSHAISMCLTSRLITR